MNLLLSQFAAELAYESEYDARYNIAPTQQVPAVRMGEDGKRKLVGLRWGLIPMWAKDTKIAYSTLNARADTIATKPAFRTAFNRRRCLILTDGYYEWLREGKDKQPFLYEVDGGKPFAFAGLWEWWPGPTGKDEPVESCTIITTDANKLASEVHDRMPVILDAKDYDAWLACEDITLVPFPVKRMSVRPVNRYVNNVRNQGEKCIAPPQGKMITSGRAGSMNDQESDSGSTTGVVIAFVLLLLFVGVAALGGAAVFFYRSAANQAAAAGAARTCCRECREGCCNEQRFNKRRACPD